MLYRNYASNIPVLCRKKFFRACNSDKKQQTKYVIIRIGQAGVMNLRIIYVDVLLIVNFYMNYLLLAFTAKITRTKMQLWRGIFSAGLGSFSALMIFLPEMNAFCSWLCKLFTAGIICLFAFGKNDFFRKWLY